MTVLLGAMSAVLFGIGDFLGGVGGRRDGTTNSPLGIAFVASVIGALIAGAYLLFLSNDQFTGNDLWWSISAGFFMSVGRPLLYRGMARGPIVVFAPVFALVMVVVPAVLGVAIGQSLAPLEVIAVLIAIPAVVLMSGEQHLPQWSELGSSSVLGSAVLTGFVTGLGALSLSLVSDDAGASPAFFIAAVGIVVVPIVGRFIGMSVALTPTVVTFGSIVGCTSIVAFFLAAITFQLGNAAIGAALISLSPGISIVLAWKFLKERLWPLQLVGAVLGAVTVLLFALAS